MCSSPVNLLRLVNARPSCLRLDSGRDGEPSPESFITVDILPPRATRVAVSLTKSPHTAHKHKQQRSLHTTTLMFKTLLFTHAANGQDFQDKHTTWKEKRWGGGFKTKQKPRMLGQNRGREWNWSIFGNKKKSKFNETVILFLCTGTWINFV